MAESDAREQIEGTCLVVGAACVFALVALVVKMDPLPVLVATECRFLVSWAVAVAFMLAYRASRGLWWFGPPALRRWLLLKCAMSFTFITLWWTAIRHAPVGDCIAIIYTAPILTSLLSRLLLGELLRPEFPLQVLLASLGTAMVLDPPFLRGLPFARAGEAPPHAAYGFVFLALAANCVVPIVTRKARQCSWIEVEHVSACLASTVLDPSLLVGQYLVCGSVPELPSAAAPGEIGLIVLAAGGSFVGIAMETKGYQLAEVGKASMFRYVEVPFAYVLQRVGTSEPVQARAMLGSVLILAACFLGLRRSTAAAAAAPKAEENDAKKQALLGS